MNSNMIKYVILSGITSGTTEFQLPILIESSVDEMGVMVGFDGEMEQIEQFCNFTYSGNGNTILIYNTINTNRIRTLVNSEFIISWGDNTTDSTLGMSNVYDIILPNALHTYISGGTYNIEVIINSPWKIEKIKREIYLPITGMTFPSTFGVLTFQVPYSNPSIEQTQTYLMDYRELTGNTEDTTISFLAIGKSRVDEFRMYGSNAIYSGLTTGSTEAGNYTGYTIDGLYYMDYVDGYTHITGLTSNYTHEEVYNGMITRNEHLIGFLDEPQIFSDVFIERGKQGVMERNLRLGEIDSVGELDVYGSGFFKVKKQ